MFKRKDWVLLRRGQGVEGDANSTSSSSDQSQESDAVSSSSESLDVSTGSSEREEEGHHVRLERSSRLGSLSGEESDSLDSDGADVRAQVREWYEAGMAHRMVRGKALRCMMCTGKRRLLLNSTALLQHIHSKVHQKRCGVEGIDDVENHVECFVFADTSSKLIEAEDEVETHGERLQRIQSLVDTMEKRKGGEKPRGKKRKSRPGKRQRMQKKGQKGNSEAG
eukprot:jgi/Picre1/29639/NNA_005022.t1